MAVSVAPRLLVFRLVVETFPVAELIALIVSATRIRFTSS